MDKVEKFEDIDRSEEIGFFHKTKGEVHKVVETNYGTNMHPIILYYCDRCRNYFHEHEGIKKTVPIKYKGSEVMQEAERKKRVAEVKKELMI